MITIHIFAYTYTFYTFIKHYIDKQINLFLLHKYLVIGTLNEIV